MYALSARHWGPHSSSIKKSILNWRDLEPVVILRSSHLVVYVDPLYRSNNKELYPFYDDIPLYSPNPLELVPIRLLS